MSSITRLYPEALSWALAHRAVVIISALALLGAATPLLPFLDTELIPDVSQGEFVVEVETAGGTPVAQTDELIRTLTAIAIESPEVEMTYSLAGALGGSSAAQAETKESLGQLNVTLKEGLRGAPEEQVMETLRSRFAGVPGIAVRFSRPALFSFKAPVSLQVKGYNLPLLEEIARDLASRLESISGLADISASVQGGNPEIRISFNRERLAALGLDISSLARIIREKIQGEVASEYSSSERRIDIRVRSRIQDRASIEDLRRLTVADAGGALIPLSALGEITIARGPVEIRRQDQERTALITMNITGRDLGSTVEEIERVIADYPLPRDFVVTIGGQRQEMALSFNSMRLAMILAMILVYLVMAAQFESLIHPLIIMATIPFGLIGVVLILIATGTSISVVVLIGVIMMAGIVVNNAIILVDTINQLKRAGVEPIRAVMEAAPRRLRPILITTATTVLGLLPMALGFGEGSEIRSPMAITVIGGLIFSTLLTLILIPTVYAAVDRKRISPAEDLREGADH
jgi:HAE1 family hydrophobic/amphiphilic exporter-1